MARLKPLLHTGSVHNFPSPSHCVLLWMMPPCWLGLVPGLKLHTVVKTVDTWLMVDFAVWKATYVLPAAYFYRSSWGRVILASCTLPYEQCFALSAGFSNVNNKHAPVNSRGLSFGGPVLLLQWRLIWFSID